VDVLFNIFEEKSASRRKYRAADMYTRYPWLAWASTKATKRDRRATSLFCTKDQGERSERQFGHHEMGPRRASRPDFYRLYCHFNLGCDRGNGRGPVTTGPRTSNSAKLVQPVPCRRKIRSKPDRDKCRDSLQGSSQAFPNRDAFESGENRRDRRS